MEEAGGSTAPDQVAMAMEIWNADKKSVVFFGDLAVKHIGSDF